MVLQKITQPTLLLDPDRCKANMHRVFKKTSRQKVGFRPHFKTHQSKEIGHWFRELGVDKITVSSVGMGEFFAEDGWNDITIAFPVNLRQMKEINQLAGRVNLGLLIVDHGTIDILGKEISTPVNIWIKIDVGTHRTGFNPGDTVGLDEIIDTFRKYPHLHFSGFLAHAGHSYQCRTITEVQRVYDQTLDMLIQLKEKYARDFPHIQISVGDTPGVSMVTQLGPVDELRPGNFIFYDLMQAEIGACTLDDIAVAMACPVVATHKERLQWIIYGGGIHFSKDFLNLEGSKKCFGRMVEFSGNSWSTEKTMEQPYLISLSQEHGVVQCNEHNFNLARPGNLTFWLPVHSCLTADAMGEYMTIDGDTVDHYRQHKYK